MIGKSLALGALSALTIGALSAGIVGGLSASADPKSNDISVSRAAEAVQQMHLSGDTGVSMGEVKVASFEQ